MLGIEPGASCRGGFELLTLLSHLQSGRITDFHHHTCVLFVCFVYERREVRKYENGLFIDSLPSARNISDQLDNSFPLSKQFSILCLCVL